MASRSKPKPKADRFEKTDAQYAITRRQRRAADQAWDTIRRGEAAKKEVLKDFPHAKSVHMPANIPAHRYRIESGFESSQGPHKLGSGPTISGAWIQAHYEIEYLRREMAKDTDIAPDVVDVEKAFVERANRTRAWRKNTKRT